MLKVVVYAPKGGVGKTTIATNVAMLLAGQGHKVWAWDLSEKELMTYFLASSPEFVGEFRLWQGAEAVI